MELGTIGSTIFKTSGWLSVILALISLALLNLTMLSSYDIALGSTFVLWVIFAAIFGFVALFHKKSRSLGLWGLGVSFFIGLFLFVIFFLAWMIIPFP